MEVEPNLPDINLDPARMEQVLGNLISNALRYTPQAGQIQLSAKQINGSLTVSVIDNGSGIPADILPHIFERSYRGDESRGGNESGLGLAIAKSLMEMRESLVLNVTYSSDNGDVVDFPSSNNEYVFSNVQKDELHLYMKELEKSDWQLEKVHVEDKGRESSHFKRLAQG